MILSSHFVSSEGALYVILPYDYQAAAHPLFEHTPVLNKNDRPGDDGTLRSVKLLVFLLGVIDLASASA